MEAPKRRWLRISEFSRLYGLHERTTRRLISRRQLSFVRRPGLGVRIDAEAYEVELERYKIPAKGSGHGQV